MFGRYLTIKSNYNPPVCFSRYVHNLINGTISTSQPLLQQQQLSQHHRNQHQHSNRNTNSNSNDTGYAISKYGFKFFTRKLSRVNNVKVAAKLRQKARLYQSDWIDCGVAPNKENAAINIFDWQPYVMFIGCAKCRIPSTNCLTYQNY